MSRPAGNRPDGFVDDALVLVAEPPAPAGVVRIEFPHLLLSVTPDQCLITEVIAAASGETVDAVADMWCTRLSGKTLVELTDDDDIAAAPSLQPLAMAVLQADDSPCRSRLAGLDILQALRDLEVPDDLVTVDVAWELLPVVAALGRAASASPSIVDALSPNQRADLLDRIHSLFAVLDGTGWDHSTNEALQNLELLLDSERLHAAFDGLLELTPAYEFADGVLATPLRWHVRPDELRATLGPFAEAFFAGVSTEGGVPGTVTVYAPLRHDHSRDLADMEVRVLAWSGELLGRAPLRYSSSADVPVLSASVAVTAAPPSTAPLGVHVDIATAGRPLPDAAALRKTAVRIAQAAGRTALMSDRAGDPARAADEWRRCSTLLTAGSAHAAAAVADTHATALSGKKEAEVQDLPWLHALVQNLRADARQRLAEVEALPSHDRVPLLRTAVRDLSFTIYAAPEVAEMHEILGLALQESDEIHERNAGVEHLRVALQIQYLLGAQRAAAVVLSHLGVIAEDAEESP